MDLYRGQAVGKISTHAIQLKLRLMPRKTHLLLLNHDYYDHHHYSCWRRLGIQPGSRRRKSYHERQTSWAVTGVARGTEALDANGDVPGNIVVGVCPFFLVCKKGIAPVETPTFLSGQEPAMMYVESTTAIAKSRNNFKEQSLV